MDSAEIERIIQAQTERFQNIIQHISQTQRGKEMIDWMKEQNIQPQFIQDDEIVVLYEEHEDLAPSDPQDNTQGNAQTPQTVLRKNLYLNWGAPDFVLIGHLYDQTRRAWQMHQPLSQEVDRNHLSQMVAFRFVEADAKSFAIAMSMDLARETGDFGPLNALHNNPVFSDLVAFTSQFSGKPETTFSEIRRCAFDGFFLHQRDLIESTEAYKADVYIQTVEKYLKTNLSHQVDLYFNTKAERGTPSPSLVMKPVDIPDLNLTTTDELAQLGTPDFGSWGKNYMTSLTEFSQIDDDLYLETNLNTAKALQILEARYPALLRVKNFASAPSRTPIPDLAQDYRAEVAQQRAEKQKALTEKRSSAQPQKRRKRRKFRFGASK